MRMRPFFHIKPVSSVFLCLQTTRRNMSVSFCLSVFLSKIDNGKNHVIRSTVAPYYPEKHFPSCSVLTLDLENINSRHI